MNKYNGQQGKTSQSFYIKVNPKCLRVQYDYAKTIKPGTTYRLTLEKNKRVVDQMKEFLKAKMVGGKINFEPWHMLSADFDNFDADNDFELAIRLLEKQQEREQKQIARHVIYPITYINKYKHAERKYNQEEGKLLKNLYLSYQIFVHNSKAELQQMVTDFNQHQSRNQLRQINLPKEKFFSNQSPRPLSQSSVPQSPAIKRKRGREGRLKLSNRSDNEDQSFSFDDKKGKRQRSPNYVSLARKISNTSEVAYNFKEETTQNKKGSPHKLKFKMFESMNNDDHRIGSAWNDDFQMKILQQNKIDQANNNHLKLQTPGNKKTTQKSGRTSDRDVKAEKPKQQRQFLHLKNEEKQPKLFSIFQSSEEQNSSFIKLQTFAKQQNQSTSNQELSQKGHLISGQQMQSMNTNPIYSFQSYKPRSFEGYTPLKKPFIHPLSEEIGSSSVSNGDSLVTDSGIRRDFHLLKDKCLYFGFLILSCFLLWHSMSPSRRV